MGGMTGVGTPELAASVSLAGGLGLFAIHNGGTEEARVADPASLFLWFNRSQCDTPLVLYAAANPLYDSRCFPCR